MNRVEYIKMAELEKSYWWFVARHKLVVSMINCRGQAYLSPANILDIGCGTGEMLRHLSKFGDTTGIDISKDAIKICNDNGVTNVEKADVQNMTFADNYFDLLTALDIFEHIDDDNKAFKECHRVCKQNGQLLLTVPAYGFLWSEHDEALSHRRRYTKAELKNKLELAGFKIEKISYCIFLLFIPILFFRILQGIFKKSTHAKTSLIILPKWLNNFLIFLLDIETLLLKWINFPFGVSIVCLAKKV